MLLVKQEIMDRLRSLVYAKSDLHFPPKKLVFFERRLRDRLGALGIDDLEQYYAQVVSDEAELAALVQGLTTNKTFFFRDAAQFAVLREKVVPELVEARNRDVVRSWSAVSQVKNGGRHPALSIRMWSLGCSTGEEAYSLAFTLLDTVRYPKAWKLEVVGTDISEKVLEAARRGVYTDDAMREMEPEVRDRHMSRVDDGWRVKDDARAIVSFNRGNLKELSAPEGGRKLTLTGMDGKAAQFDAAGCFDVVFCRNVMIYFDREAQQRLVDALYDCIRPGGYLFTGDSEPLHLFMHGFTRPAGGALYYRKPD